MSWPTGSMISQPSSPQIFRLCLAKYSTMADVEALLLQPRKNLAMLAESFVCDVRLAVPTSAIDFFLGTERLATEPLLDFGFWGAGQRAASVAGGRRSWLA